MKTQKAIYLAALCSAGLFVVFLALSCASSGVDDPDSDVYLIVTAGPGSVLCGSKSAHTFNVENRLKVSSAGNQFNDVVVNQVQLTSSNTSKLLSISKSTIDAVLIANKAKASITVNNILQAGPGCVDDDTIAATVTFFGETVGGDDVQGSRVITVAFSCPGMTVALEAAPTSGTEPLSVTATATVSGGFAGTGYVYDWDFGDGATKSVTSTSTTNTQVHSYNSTGSPYTLQVTVTDKCTPTAQTASDMDTITVTP